MTEPEFIGKNDIAQDITIITSGVVSKVNRPQIQWMCYETIGDVDDSEQMKKHLTEEEFKEYKYTHDVKRCFETDKADTYLKEETFKKYNAVGYTRLEVLPFLNGKPWNNLALNYVQSLRPSSLRVSTGMIHCDSCRWRVTVMLEKDERTIKNITQEVEVGLYGCRHGADLNHVMKNGTSAPYVDCWINEEALKRIDLK